MQVEGSRLSNREPTSRHLILSWLNSLLDLQLTAIEQLGSGAVYCQVIHLLHPSHLPPHKINWQARSDYEFLGNLRLLQDAFLKIGLSKPIDIQRLAKAKYQDNFDFALWLRGYFLQQSHRHPTFHDADCSLSHSPRKPDFSFAHRSPTKKPTPRPPRGPRCSCCSRRGGEEAAKRKIRGLKVVFEMLREVLESGESSERQLSLVEGIISLQYD